MRARTLHAGWGGGTLDARPTGAKGRRMGQWRRGLQGSLDAERAGALDSRRGDRGAVDAGCAGFGGGA